MLCLVLGGCGFVSNATRSDTARAKVGDCIGVVAGNTLDTQTQPVDCGSPDTVYRVRSATANKQDCGPEYSSYQETFRGGTTAYLCLIPDLKPGGCYHQDTVSGFAHADCDSVDATARVVKRVDGSSDPGLCDPTGTYVTLKDPPTTFCLVNPRG